MAVALRIFDEMLVSGIVSIRRIMTPNSFFFFFKKCLLVKFDEMFASSIVSVIVACG